METILIKLGKAYYNQGFFNIKKQNEHHFGAKDTAIQVHLGTAKTITGYINRTANPTGTPRIMCGVEYTNWIQKNFKQGDTVILEILGDNSLRFREPNKDKLN